ncbi:hypothetical protein HDU81_008601 [Chytriomyces hyalinus]|nr:hypothetical protein HDU81_008601 [Chytriomyces hyalinus]
MPLSSDQLNLLRLIMRVFCSTSVALNLSVIACVVTLERFHKPMSYLQAHLAGLEIMQASIYIIGTEVAKTAPAVCLFAGIVGQFFATAVTCMNLIISLYVYLSIIYRRAVAERYWYYYHGYVWGMAVLLTGLLFVMQAVLKRGSVIGDSTFECWISSDYPELRIHFFYLPLWIHSAFIFAIYARILLFLRSHHNAKNEENIQTGVIPAAPEPKVVSYGEESSESNQEKTSVRALSISVTGSNAPTSFSRKAIASPLTSKMFTITSGKSAMSRGNKLLLVKAGVTATGFIISWMPASVARMYTLFTGIPSPFWLTILTAVGMSTFGFWNPGVFFLTWFWPAFSKFYSTRRATEGNALLSNRTNASDVKSGSGM